MLQHFEIALYNKIAPISFIIKEALNQALTPSFLFRKIKFSQPKREIFI